MLVNWQFVLSAHDLTYDIGIGFDLDFSSQLRIRYAVLVAIGIFTINKHQDELS